MKILPPPTRCEVSHHEALIGIVRAGGIEWISEALNDEAIFWVGWRGLIRHARAGRAGSLAPAPA